MNPAGADETLESQLMAIVNGVGDAGSAGTSSGASGGSSRRKQRRNGAPTATETYRVVGSRRARWSSLQRGNTRSSATSGWIEKYRSPVSYPIVIRRDHRVVAKEGTGRLGSFCTLSDRLKRCFPERNPEKLYHGTSSAHSSLRSKDSRSRPGGPRLIRLPVCGDNRLRRGYGG